MNLLQQCLCLFRQRVAPMSLMMMMVLVVLVIIIQLLTLQLVYVVKTSSDSDRRPSWLNGLGKRSVDSADVRERGVTDIRRAAEAEVGIASLVTQRVQKAQAAETAEISKAERRHDDSKTAQRLADKIGNPVESFALSVPKSPKVNVPNPLKVKGAEKQPPTDKANKDVKPAAVLQPSDVATQTEVEQLTQILERRLAEGQQERSAFLNNLKNCSSRYAVENVRRVCHDTNCSRQVPASPTERVRWLLGPKHQLTSQQASSFDSLARGVPSKKYIFVTAASSNHYEESQALVLNLRHNLLPKLRNTSFTFLYYDLGLSALQRRRVEKNCNCTVMSFNKTLLPPHARHLMCYAWKPALLQALVGRAEVVVYLDTSIRFQPDMDVQRFLDTVTQRGLQTLPNGDAIPNHTVQVRIL
jgi:hypothetical protein